MKVALDTNALYTSEAGTARYVRKLASGLRQAATPDLEVTELAWPVANLSYRQPHRAIRT